MRALWRRFLSKGEAETLLCLRKGAGKASIRAALRFVSAAGAHPDKGGSDQQAQQLQKARDLLLNHKDTPDTPRQPEDIPCLVKPLTCLRERQEICRLCQSRIEKEKRRMKKDEEEIQFNLASTMVPQEGALPTIRTTPPTRSGALPTSHPEPASHTKATTSRTDAGTTQEDGVIEGEEAAIGGTGCCSGSWGCWKFFEILRDPFGCCCPTTAH
ncbi:unnamed protein product [Vitrella brassicaformis CCMP3155]|uniref:Uncharacterized protein n=1 Tax=Vitrella brassicaformis (strain CCMP3155) TaxID=1169540 RepID=A0A0G4EGV8_VITBC|nr:unnamed protein product [Vitrella brassicaformis CCMP3155]|eukprot:CEL94708.1 unnamed protein product [Vitrella brassicaformis CCMP3155]